MLHSENNTKKKSNNQATNLIITYLETSNLKYFMEDDTEFMVPVSFDNIPALLIRIGTAYDDKISVFAKICNIKDEDKRREMYSVMNSLNTKYSFVCFNIWENGSVCAELQFIVDIYTSMEVVEKYLSAFFSICEESAQKILNTLWLKPAFEENQDYSEEFMGEVQDYDFLSDETDESYEDEENDSCDDYDNYDEYDDYEEYEEAPDDYDEMEYEDIPSEPEEPTLIAFPDLFEDNSSEDYLEDSPSDSEDESDSDDSSDKN